MIGVQVLWIMIFLTIATVGRYLGSDNETFRPMTDPLKSSSRFLWMLRLFSKKFVPTLNRDEVPLIQVFPPGKHCDRRFFRVAISESPYQNRVLFYNSPNSRASADLSVIAPPLPPQIVAGSKLALVLKDITYISPEGSLLLDKFTLVVPRGQMVSVVGEVEDVGEYLVAIIAGICHRAGGVIRSFRTKLEQRAVGICPVNFFLFDEMTLLDNGNLFLSYRSSQGTQFHLDTRKSQCAFMVDVTTSFNVSKSTVQICPRSSRTCCLSSERQLWWTTTLEACRMQTRGRFV